MRRSVEQMIFHFIVIVTIAYYRKKQKLCSNSDHDHDNCSPQIPVTMATYFEPSFQNDDDDDGGLMFIPLSSDRRSNSTSQILQCYKFEEDEPVSAV